MAMVKKIPSDGSPPRPWGRRGGPGPEPGDDRFTPTPVGTAPIPPSPPSVRTVHPHARGDGPVVARDLGLDLGSPPRPWGRRAGDRVHVSPFRFTPTPVGTAGRSVRASAGPTVHPHARGDGDRPQHVLDAVSGSPPRPWGRQEASCLRTSKLRFTPTPVGTAGSCWSLAGAVSVHPHARGDGLTKRKAWGPKDGSPPRPWGRPDRADGQGRAARFTPTPVGTATHTIQTFYTQSVHPHARGDGYLGSAQKGRRGGSPPRPWGRLRLWASATIVPRFTPTPVGTANGCHYFCPLDSVHPHARGDGSER